MTTLFFTNLCYDMRGPIYNWWLVMLFGIIAFLPNNCLIANSTLQENSNQVIPNQDAGFNCLVLGFSGYFHPSRWKSCLPSSMAGLDITGAPQPKLVVEGTGRELIEVANPTCRDFSIQIPAEGYVSFHWENVGSSVLPPPDGPFFAFFVNGERKNLADKNTRHTSDFLRKGDRITFRLLPNSLHTVLIRDFVYMNNTRISITEVVVPSPIELYLSDFSQLEHLTQPDLVGQPYIDTDGDPQTVDDHVFLLDEGTSLDISWEDYVHCEELGTTLIIREWSIYDPCGDNEVRIQQELRCHLKSMEDQ